MRYNNNNNNTSLNTLLKAWNMLGLQKGNTNRNITKKYHKLAAQTHPNKGGNTAKFQEVQHLYSAIVKAYRDQRLNAVVAAAEARRRGNARATGIKSLSAARTPISTLGVRITNQKRRAPPKPAKSGNGVVLFSSRSTGPGRRRGVGKRRSGWYGLTSFN